MILQIQLANIPNQSVSVDIEGKHLVFEFVTRGGQLYANSIAVEDEVIVRGIACLNKNNIIGLVNSGLSGKLYFLDTEGSESPNYTGFNTRWIFLYEGE